MQDDKELTAHHDRVYEIDRWTEYQWRYACEEHGDLSALVDAGRQRLFSAPDLFREVFARLFGDPDRLEQVRPEDAWINEAHAEIDEHPLLKTLRHRCRGDRFSAARATVGLGNELLDRLPPSPGAEDPEAVRQQVRELLDFASGRSEVAQLRLEGKQRVAAMAEFASAARTGLPAAIHISVCAAQEGLDRDEECLAGVGIGSPQIGHPMAPELKATLAKRIRQNPRLQQLAAQAGRLRRIAIAKERSRADRAPEELTDVELGNDLGRLLPTELVKLADQRRWLEFAKGYCEASLLQYRIEGHERLGRGPIAVCIDESSSMEGAKSIWASAIAIALLQVAALQQRFARVIHFNGEVVRVDDWAAGCVDPVALLDSMAEFRGGGTAFEPPLRAALEAIEDASALTKADVIMITDGEAPVTDEFVAEWTSARARLGFKCYAVHVDSPGGVAPASLSAIADEVIALQDVRADEAATDALFSV